MEKLIGLCALVALQFAGTTKSRSSRTRLTIMTMKKPGLVFAILPLCGAAAFAQSSGDEPALEPAKFAESNARGETTVQLDVGFGIRAVPPSRVTVPAGETLRVTAPVLGQSTNYIWTKNGRAIAGTSGNVLVLDHVISSDSGTYQCLFSTPATLPQPSQSLILGVGPTDRLINISTRGNIGAGGNETLVSGFVVGASGQGKKLILRAIGPSLSLFGVANPLRSPVLRVFDSSGKLYENGYVYPAVVGGPTYENDLAESLARAGAFPTPAGARDAVVMMPFLPGTYTAQVTSGDGSGGNVLLEVYEVP
jgi:hypothetical protein